MQFKHQIPDKGPGLPLQLEQAGLSKQHMEEQSVQQRTHSLNKYEEEHQQEHGSELLTALNV